MRIINHPVAALMVAGTLVAGTLLGSGSRGVPITYAAPSGSPSGTATPIYTVAQVRGLITQHPGAWVGRTVLVRGIVEGPFVFCAETRPCPPATLGLIDTEDQIMAPDRYLPIAAEPVALPVTLLRHIPLLDSLVSPAQPMQFGRMAQYRLRVAADPALCSRNPAVLCYEGLAVGGA